MDMLARLFQNKKNSSDISRFRCSSNKNTSGTGQRQWSDRRWARLVVFTDHDIKGRCIVFDSKVQHPIESQQVGARKRCQRGNPGLLTPGRPPPPTDTGQGVGHGGSAQKYTPLKHLSEHQTYAELMFGSVSMSYKGGTLKVHSLKGHTPQLMITSVFTPVKPQRESNCDQDTFDTYSLQSSVQSTSAENSTPKDIIGAGKSSSIIAQSVPVAVPNSPKRRTQENEDSGISGSMTDSYTSHNQPHSSPSSTTSATSNSFHMMQRRWLRNQNTSLERNLKQRSFDEMSDVSQTPASKRPPKFGIGVIIGEPEQGMENHGDFVNFFFSHITLIEAHMKKIKIDIEKASAHKSKFTIIVHEAYEHLYDSLYNLYTAPRLKEPVWLNMMTFSTQKVVLCKQFLKEFMNVIEKFDNKSNKCFVSTLITAVLTHHLAWVPTVTPAGAAPSRTYLDKHSAKWLKTLSKSHPYNPLWAQLGDLYGAIGFPLRLSKTVVVGKKQDVVTRFLYILSYFIRSSQVYETSQSAIKFDPQDDDLQDEGQGCGSEMEPIKEAPSRRNSEHSQNEVSTQNRVLFKDCSELHINEMPDEMRTSAETVLTASSCQTDVTLQENPQICMCDMPDSASVENMLDDDGQPDSFHKVNCENVTNFSYDVVCSSCGNTKLEYVAPPSEKALCDTEGYLAHCLEQGEQMVLSNALVPEMSDEVNLSRSMLLFRLLNPEKELETSQIENLVHEAEKENISNNEIGAENISTNSKLLRVNLIKPQFDFENQNTPPNEVVTDKKEECSEHLEDNNDNCDNIDDEHSGACQLSPVTIKEEVSVQRIRHVGKSTFFAAVDCNEIIDCPPEDKFRMDSSTFYIPPAKEQLRNTCDVPSGNDNIENTCHHILKSGQKYRSESQEVFFEEASCDNRDLESSAVFSDFSHESKSNRDSRRSAFDSNRESGFEDSYAFDSGVFDSKNSKFRKESSTNKSIDDPSATKSETLLTPTKSRNSSETSRGKVNRHRKLRLGISRSNSIFDEYFIDNSLEIPDNLNNVLKNIPLTKSKQASDYLQDIIGFSSDYVPDLLPNKEELDQLSTETQAEARINKTVFVQRGISQFDEYFSRDGDPIHLPDQKTIETTTTDEKTTLEDSDTIEQCSNQCLSNPDEQPEKCLSDSDIMETDYGLVERSESFSMRRRTNSRGSMFNRQNSTQSVPGRCRSVTPTELGKRRHRSSNSSQVDIENLEWNLKDMPMPGHDEEEPDSPEPAGHFTHNFGSSLMANFTPHYLPDFVLQGTNDTNIYPKLHNDLKMSVKNSVLDEPIAETACVVADVDKWSVKELTCQYDSADRVTHNEVVPSQLVCSIIESVHNLWKLKMSPEFCLWHLEDRLQEVFFKSRTLAEYLRLNPVFDMRQLTNDLEFDPSDVRLLFAVAGTHSPRLSMGLMDFPK